MKSNDVKQYLKNYKLKKRCNLNRPSGPRKQAIIFQYWTLTWPLTYTYYIQYTHIT